MSTAEITLNDVDFNSLSFDKQKEHFLNVAKKALPLWGYPNDTTITLLNITENATYRLEHTGLDTIVMRVHRLDYAQKNSIRTELAWILALRKETSLHLATPIPSQDGNYIQTIETPEMHERRHVVCFSFEEGKAPTDSHDDTEFIGKLLPLATSCQTGSAFLFFDLLPLLMIN